ncbi:MAG: response regulator [Candidatus Aminicenantes bacterium]|nr:response regulator [Candidatus Aminicenantes bacterium]
MEKASILIVEDEAILADGMKKTLKKLGYAVVGIASTADGAIRQAGDRKPDLVLMDIELRGKVDGIKAAQEIRRQFDIPVVFTTAHGDKQTLQRAKVTEPYGYIIKPVEERELHCNIEIALFRHKTEAEILKKKKLEAFSTFAEGIAHDFNNLLNIVNGYIEVAMKRCEIDEKICAPLLKKARENLFTAGDLSKKFLNIFKGNPLIRKNIKFSTTIKKGINKVSVPENLDISYDLDHSIKRISINGDEDLLEEMFSNILLNGVEAMTEKKKGTIKITVEDITLGSDNNFHMQKGKYVKVSIRDEGKGIPENNLGRVFDPYFSTKDNPTKKGLGLGLTTCYSIVKNHSGHIEIKSEEGKETTVDIYLPASP